MNLVLVGLNHCSAPVAVRERVAFPRAKLGEATCELLGAAKLAEAAIVSTCNRVEIYALAADAELAGPSLRRYLHAYHKLTEPLDGYLYERHNRDCIAHLMNVVCGLDSMVLGETEILGQVKDAYAAAQIAGATGAALNRLFQKAFAAAKHIRSTTAITRGSTSVANVAVELAEKIFRDLAHSTVMIIGTGAMSEATAKALRSRGAGTLLVCGRDREKSGALAAQLGGRAIHYDDWPVEFPKVDIVISATASPHPIVTREKFVPLMKARHNRPLFLIDIGVPRDIETGCDELENVYLYNMDDMQQIAKDNLAVREREITVCRELIAERVTRLAEWLEERYQ